LIRGGKAELMMWTNRLPLAVAIVAVAAGCSGGHSGPTTHTIAGRAVDQRTGRGLPGVTVVIGNQRAVTDAQGHFTLTAVPSGSAALRASAKYHETAAVPLPTSSPYNVSVSLQPTSVTVTAKSDLTHKPLAATVTAGGQKYQAKHGSVTVYGVGVGDTIRVAAPDYSPERVRIHSGSVTITLAAGPKATAIFLSQAEINLDYKTQANFVHPLEYRYVSRSAMIAAYRKADRTGYGQQRWTFKSLTLLPTWRFPGCDGHGATTFHHVAAIEYTAVNAAPGGASQTSHGVEHLVQANGRWRWFPIVPGCT
jgi:CarboxypepD_reg-like domain